eukprot:c15921_g1_i1 orf=184-1443(+)
MLFRCSIRMTILILFCTYLLCFAFQCSPCNAVTLSLKIAHKFSAEAKEFWSGKYGDSFLPWPSKGTGKYYEILHRQDVARHGRKLKTYQTVYFSSGNETVNLGEQFGWLHYAFVDLGTPRISFLVALDTGSDLLWVPCECRQCAPTPSPSYGLVGISEKDLNVYSPSSSRTSKRVTCDDSFCNMGDWCQTAQADCPYDVQYLSDNTSTSGILVEDVIYLSDGDRFGFNGSMATSVIFGCGQVQSGSFLDGGAPDGLLGLGLGNITVPEFLDKAGLVDNSFSMCFGPDDSGRILFGDKGDSYQQTTSFLQINETYLVYMVAVEKIVIGSVVLEVPGLTTLVDTGTSFTYLPEKVYSAVTTKFDEQVRETKVSYAPWEFCYEASKFEGAMDTPSLSLVFHGGGNFSIYNPLIALYDELRTS